MSQNHFQESSRDIASFPATMTAPHSVGQAALPGRYLTVAPGIFPALADGGTFFALSWFGLWLSMVTWSWSV